MQSNIIYARDVYQSLGYVRWENFANLIKRAQGLIKTGEAMGCIKSTTRAAALGSGAIRSIIDYELDEPALRLIETLSSGFKLNGHYPIRNETAIIRLVEKYFTAKGMTVDSQARIGSVVFDCLIEDRVVIEIDEPHHANARRQLTKDTLKDKFATDAGYEVARFTLEHDAIDVILTVESMLFKEVVGGTASVKSEHHS